MILLVSIAALVALLTAPVGSAAPATHLGISVPATSVAGAAVAVKVTALAADGSTDTGYVGTVYFTSTDANAVLPDDYTFVAGDKGVHTFSVTFSTNGSPTVTATDTVTSSKTGTSAADTVSAGAVTHFSVSAPTPIVAGTTPTVTVTALNASNAVVTGFAADHVRITSTDKAATMPAAAALTSGVGQFTVPFDTAGTQTVTATDIVEPISGSLRVAVAGASAATLKVSIPAASIAGQSVAVKVSAIDAGGNIDTNYIGTVTFTSTDGSAVLPANYTFQAADHGVHSFNATLVTLTGQTVHASDGTISGTSGSDVVAAGTVTHLGVTAPTPTKAAGVAETVTVNALNAYNVVVAAGFTSKVHITSTDKAATLPADATLASGTLGFSVTLNTGGHQTITAAATTAASIKGTLAQLVTGGAVAALTVAIPAKGIAGDTLPAVTVTAVDAGGNVVTNYGGTVTLSSSTDGSVVVPASYTFTAADNGVHTFRTVRLMTAGNETVHATDGTNVGTSSADVVAAGTVTHLSVDKTAGTYSKVANTAFSVIVKALNAYDATVIGYTGTVHLTSSDGNTFKAITLPADSTLTNGVGTFTGIELETVGNQTVTATDTTKKTITGTRQFTVTVGAAATLKVTVPKYAVNAGPAVNVTVTALDAGGNTVPSYVGVVTLTSSDGSAVMPAPHTFTTGGGFDNGTYVFSVPFATAGNQTVTATGTTGVLPTGTSAAIKVH